MLKIAKVLVATLGLVSPAIADEITTEKRALLQNAMLSHVDTVLVDGQYTYLDQAQNIMRTVYPSNVHPMIVPIDDGYFVCSEMVDETGQSVTADFLVRETTDGYRVIQMIVNDRGSLQKMMAGAS